MSDLEPLPFRLDRIRQGAGALGFGFAAIFSSSRGEPR